MKENLKNKKGITLIALVITIIVLLILAIVTIRIVVNQNIINHANNAVTAYNEAQNNESEQLTWAEELMKNKGGSSSSNSGSSTSGGQSNNADLSLLSSQEIQELTNAGVYQDGGQDDLVIASNDAKRVTISTNSGGIILCIVIYEGDNIYAYGTSNSEENGIRPLNKWFQVVGMTEGGLSLAEYTGGALINVSEFTTVNSPTLLNRIVATFNN